MSVQLAKSFATKIKFNMFRFFAILSGSIMIDYYKGLDDKGVLPKRMMFHGNWRPVVDRGPGQNHDPRPFPAPAKSKHLPGGKPRPRPRPINLPPAPAKN